MTVFKSINFGTLSLKDALDLAILIEEEAQERYQEFVDQMEIHHTPQAAGFFRTMAGNEAKHGADLAERRRKLFANEPSEVKRSMLWDVEAPDYDKTRAFMSVRQCMQVALQCEVKAHDFFVAALEHITNPDVLKLFTELRDEEVLHQQLVKKEMQALPQTPDVDPDDYADEPVAQ
jgi:rubrerythrin